MHTLIVILSGFLLLGICLALGQKFFSLAKGALLFLPLWLIGAGFNLWLGMTHGYSFQEELPIFLVIFAIPSLIALLIWWKAHASSVV
ncbi:MAG TPA: hypothetical protein PLM98_08400 [Thiolinea sp.]|nr:hypothetical protein [Thiolinea sp.]